MITVLILIILFVWLYMMHNIATELPNWVLKHIQYIENEKQNVEFDFFKTYSISTTENKNEEENKEYQFFNENNK